MTQPDINNPGSLGNVFGASAAGGLGGLLPNRAGQGTAGPGQTPPTTETVSSPPAEPAADVPVQAAGPPPEGAPDTFPVGVYLLPAAIQAASRRRRSRRLDNYQLVVEAIDSLRTELPGLVARRHAGPARRDGSLFPPRHGASTTAAAARDGRRRLWSFQATEADTEVIDDLVDAVGARSRSELISCALEAYLLPRRRR